MFGWLKDALSSREKTDPQADANDTSDSAPKPDGAVRAYEEQIARGNHFLDQGRPKEASDAYRQAVSLRPDDAMARVNLGFALLEQGLLDDARQSLQQAVRLEPSNADALYMLGTISASRSQFDQAIDLFSKVLETKPDFEIVYGELCRALFQAGRLEDARGVARKGIGLFPETADLQCYQGNLLVAEKDFANAIPCFRKALSIQPGYAEAYSGMGLALRGNKQLEEAVGSCRHAIAIKPDFAEAHYNLGLALKNQGLLDDAIRSYRKALVLNPAFAEAYNDLGLALKEQGKLEEAAESCRHALTLKPGHAEAYRNLGLIFQEQGKLDLAVEYYLKAISIEPNSALAHNNLACTFQKQGKLDAAIERYRQALSLEPDSVEIHNNLGSALQLQGNLDEAIEYFHKALVLEPDCIEARGNLLFVLSYHAGHGAAEYLAEALLYGKTLGASARPYAAWKTGQDSPDVQPLRVGLVSGDLRNHPAGFFLESILQHLDPARVELLAYPTQSVEDDLTARIKPRFAAWHSLVGLNDEAAAKRIHEDGVHVLIDLAGHTAHNRLPVFAWKPAPVQVTWLGYFASTGVAEIDYLLADPVSVPAAEQARFTEKIWYLPDTRLCFTPPAENAGLAVNALPALRNGTLTFGCFQNLTKINEAVLAAWGRIFQALPNARLRLQSKQLNSHTMRDAILQRLDRVGIAASRVTVHGQSPREAYLAAHAEVDIILDTFPYPGGTTTCEALWMGVPTLTLAGDSLIERQGASMLSCAGLQDWVARDTDDYVSLALRHAADLDGLAKLRLGLRQKVLASPLFDAPRFAANLDTALHDMWRQKAARDPGSLGLNR